MLTQFELIELVLSSDEIEERERDRLRFEYDEVSFTHFISSRDGLERENSVLYLSILK